MRRFLMSSCLLGLLMLGSCQNIISVNVDDEQEIQWIQYYNQADETFYIFYTHKNNGYFEDREPLSETEVDRMFINEDQRYFRFRINNYWTMLYLDNAKWVEYGK